MAVAFDKYTEWKAGEGTPVKYSVEFRGSADLVNIRAESGVNYGDVVVDVDVIIVNHPLNSQNSFEAADFALLSYGDLNPKVNYQFIDGQTYYGSTLPEPQSLPTNMCVIEFRGDTFRPNPNKVSLWTTTGGNVLVSADTENTWTFHVSHTKTIVLTGALNQPILTWSTSGAGPNHVEWLDQEVWFSRADFPTTYTLTYNANGGSNAPAPQTAQDYASHTFTIGSEAPTHAWWDFLGWADSASATTAQYTSGDTITLQRSAPNKTIYAVWDKSYRPGDTFNNNTWWSHDRAAGAADIRNAANTGWATMRTIGGDGSRTGNPPYIYSGSNWANQRRIGSE